MQTTVTSETRNYEAKGLLKCKGLKFSVTFETYAEASEQGRKVVLDALALRKFRMSPSLVDSVEFFITWCFDRETRYSKLGHTFEVEVEKSEAGSTSVLLRSQSEVWTSSFLMFFGRNGACHTFADVQHDGKRREVKGRAALQFAQIV